MGDLTGGQKWCPREVKRFWGEEARPCKGRPFLEKMGIGDPGGVRVIGDTLVIPMRTTRDWLTNLQLIDPGGRIEYLPGADVKGTYCDFGSKSALQRTNTVYICEGWANGWTIHDDTNSVVCAVFFRSEFLTVASEIRRLYPHAHIIVCADNERWSYAEREGQIFPNPGTLAAFEASERVGGQYVAPDFADLHGRPTSFNDLRLREGPEAVVRWLDPNQTIYAKDYLEGHDVLDAVCRARFPDLDGQHVRAGALLCRVVDGLANTTESGTRGGLESARLLGSIGLQVAGDGLLLANRGGWLHKRLEDRWPDGRWKSLLRDLPDARPTRPKYFTKSLTSRATSVPLRLLTHTVIVPSISAPNVSEIGRAEPGEEPRKAGRPAEAVERAAESRGGDPASARGEHRRGEPGGSGGAAGAGAVAARVPGRGPEGEEKKGSSAAGQPDV